MNKVLLLFLALIFLCRHPSSIAFSTIAIQPLHVSAQGSSLIIALSPRQFIIPRLPAATTCHSPTRRLSDYARHESMKEKSRGRHLGLTHRPHRDHKSLVLLISRHYSVHYCILSHYISEGRRVMTHVNKNHSATNSPTTVPPHRVKLHLNPPTPTTTLLSFRPLTPSSSIHMRHSHSS